MRKKVIIVICGILGLIILPVLFVFTAAVVSYYTSEYPLDFRIDSVELQRIDLNHPAFAGKRLYLMKTKGHTVHTEHSWRVFPKYSNGSVDSIVDISIVTLDGNRLTEKFQRLLPPSSIYDDDDDFIVDNGHENFSASINRTIESQRAAIYRGWLSIQGKNQYCILALDDSVGIPRFISILFPDRIISARVDNHPTRFNILESSPDYLLDSLSKENIKDGRKMAK